MNNITQQCLTAGEWSDEFVGGAGCVDFDAMTAQEADDFWAMWAGC